MCIRDRSQALVGYYRVLEPVNAGFERLHLAGLKEGAAYQISDRKEILFGDELMQAGLVAVSYTHLIRWQI